MGVGVGIGCMGQNIAVIKPAFRGGSRTISEGVRYDQITVHSLSIWKGRHEQTLTFATHPAIYTHS